MSGAVTQDQQRQEAIERLRTLEEKGLMPQVRRDFEQGRLHFSERMPLPNGEAAGILYWLDQSPELERVVREFEERTGALAYHATHEVFPFGEVLDIFYVSKYAEEWEECDRADLENGYSLVYAVNLTDNWLSELGTIGFAVSAGGLIRNA